MTKLLIRVLAYLKYINTWAAIEADKQITADIDFRKAVQDWQQDINKTYLAKRNSCK